MVGTRRSRQGASELPPAAQQPDAATAPAQQHRTHAGGASGKRARAQQQQQRQNGQQQSQHEEGGALQNGGSGPHAVGDTDPAQQQDGQLDAFRKQPQLATALTALLQQLHDPTTLLQPSTDVSATCRATAAALYRHMARQILSALSKGEAKAVQSGAEPILPELHVGEGFDAEQVWLQLELATNTCLKSVRRMVSRCMGPQGNGPDSIVKPQYQQQIEDIIVEAEGKGMEDGSSDEGEEGHGDGMDMDSDGLEEDGEGESDEDGLEGLGSDLEEEDGGRGRRSGKSVGKKSGKRVGKSEQGLHPVEDRFMRLSEMEAFLQEAEEKAAGGDEEEEEEEEAEEGEEDEEDEGDEDGSGDEDLIQALKKASRRGHAGSDDEEEGDGDGEEMAALMRRTARLAGKKAGAKGKGGDGDGDKRSVMYKDFFGDEDGDDEEEDEEDGGEGEGDDDQGLSDLEGDEGEEGEEEEDGEEGGGRGGDVRAAARQAAARKARGSRGEGAFEQEEEEEGGDGRRGSGARASSRGGQADGVELSTHELRLARLQERIAVLEEEALADKDWFLRGEADATRRPLNSALEIDMDFDTTVKPPPQPTEQGTADLESMIKKRIADRKWDDVVRVVPPPLEKAKKEVELDDSRSKKGLGEVYEEQYVKATAGGTSAAPDKDEKLRQEAKALFQLLCGKLDALSHFHYAPKPVLEELAVRSDIAAVLMEEAAPVAVSAASMRLPGEVFKSKDEGAPQADGEKTREDRKRQRAQRKRARKSETARKDAEVRAKAISEGGTAPVSGRKSDDAAVLAKASKRARLLQGDQPSGGRSEFGKSAAVFKRLQEQQEQAKAGIKFKVPKEKPTASSAALRL